MLIERKIINFINQCVQLSNVLKVNGIHLPFNAEKSAVIKSSFSNYDNWLEITLKVNVNENLAFA